LSTSDLLSSGVELERSPYVQEEVVAPLMGRIRTQLADFNLRLSDRKTKLDRAVQTHRHIEQVRTRRRGQTGRSGSSAVLFSQEWFL